MDGQTYDDVLAGVTERFEANVAEAEAAVAAAGGRFLSMTALNECMGNAVKATVEETSDVALLAVVATRPWLLHVDPRLYGQLPTPREGLDHALKASLYADLKEVRLARLGEGQDADTLADVAGTAMEALSEIEATGVRFRDSEDTRRILGAGNWDDDMVYGVGMPLARFLVERGRPGLGNDLTAAIEAREAVMERPTAPSPR